MDILSMILAKNQGGSPGGSGKIETKKLTFDGDMSKKIDVLGVSVVKLSNDPIDLNSVTSATFRMYTCHQDFAEEQVTDTVLTKTDYMVNTDVGLYFLTTLEQGESSLIAISAPEDNTDLGVEKGLYVTAIDKSATNNIMHIYVSEIVTETIHPIDPKYIPGAVIPVVEISTEIYEDANNAEYSVSLTTEETTIMNNVCAAGVPLVLKCKIFGTVASILMNVVGEEGLVMAGGDYFGMCHLNYMSGEIVVMKNGQNDL